MWPILLLLFSCTNSEYIVPDISFQVLENGGFEASIPDEPGLRLFTFNGIRNGNISLNSPGSITGETKTATNGRWVVRKPFANLLPGDVLFYWVFVQKDRIGFTKQASWTVPVDTRFCLASATTFNDGRSACYDKLLFEETFADIGSKWVQENYFSFDPDEFVVYRNRSESLFVRDGILNIRPIPMEAIYGEDFILNETLDLSESCTGLHGTYQCNRTAVGAFILPPIMSAKITTRNSFWFKHGKIEVRAKLPKGDWLFPQIYLEPKHSKYGHRLRSGRIILAFARGNEVLRCDGKNVGNDLLYGGPMIAPLLKMKDNFPSYKYNEKLSDNFHTYSVIWNEGIIAYVDDFAYAKIEHRGNLKTIKTLMKWEESSSDSAPFDEEFYLSIGVSVGGPDVFPDGCTSSTAPGYAKPWRNGASKASYAFWEARSSWQATWSDPVLQVDQVRVWAL